MKDERTRALTSPDAKAYVNYWLNKEGYVIRKPDCWLKNGEDFHTDQLKIQIYVDYNTDYAEVAGQIKKSDADMAPKHRNSVTLYYKKKDLLHAALDLIILEATRLMLIETRLLMKFDPAADPGFVNISTFVRNITTQNIDLAIESLKHYVWQVKRKLNNKKVIHHLVPVITGEQGTGKSQNIERFLRPMEHYKIDLQDALQLTDERRYFSYQRNFVAILDEMSKIGLTDFNKFKNFISTPILTPRVLGSHSTPEIKQNVSLIGSSNFPLNEQFFDPSGMRRFVEIKVDKEISQEISEGIDYMAIWKSVDENAPSPIIPYLKQLTVHQEAMRTKDIFEEFMEEFRIDTSKPATYRVRIREGMYESFKKWAKDSGNEGNLCKDQIIRTRLANKGIKQAGPFQGIYYYMVNEDCMLNPDYVATSAAALETDVNIEEVESIPVLEAALKKAVEHQNYELAAQIDRRIKMLKHKNGVNGILLDL